MRNEKQEASAHSDSHAVSSSSYSPTLRNTTGPNAAVSLRLSTSEEGLELARTAVEIAIDGKGLDVRGIDMQGISDIADYFVIISGTSERHVKGLADKIKEKMPERPQDVNGYDIGEWILLDYGNVIVHVFYEPTRQHYAFDALWEKAEEIKLNEELEQAVRKLRTGLIR